MSDVENVEIEEETKTDFTIEIKLSDRNLQYRSDFNEPETIFWIEAVKDLILKSAFEKADLKAQ
jgi:hypothetical protein